MVPAPASTDLRFSASILSAPELRKEHFAARQTLLALQGKITSSPIVEAAAKWRGYEAALACWGFLLEMELKRRGMSVHPRGIFTKTMLEGAAELPKWVGEI